MPTYQYECDACAHAFEQMQSMLDKKLRKCPACGKSKLVRLIGAGTGIIFKGSGFYETDYKNKGKPSSSESKTVTEKADAPVASTPCATDAAGSAGSCACAE